MNSDFVRLSARRPIICLVTDRRRLSPGAVLDRQLNDLIALVVAAVKADALRPLATAVRASS